MRNTTVAAGRRRTAYFPGRGGRLPVSVAVRGIFNHRLPLI
ncbi:hypothetical protein [Hymenobacter defluvii]|nr:hypothetical protein [Hymenobacter defluvii]